MKATIKDEFKEQRPDSQFPEWTSYVGEDAEHLKQRMMAKGCSPERYSFDSDKVPEPKVKVGDVDDNL
jgi:hypothetical protein